VAVGEEEHHRQRDGALPEVRAGRLAERRGRLLDVEHVVDDLEGQAEGGAVAAEGGEFVRRALAEDAGDLGRTGEERGGLAVDAPLVILAVRAACAKR
jgi:hypothetical protein